MRGRRKRKILTVLSAVSSHGGKAVIVNNNMDLQILKILHLEEKKAVETLKSYLETLDNQHVSTYMRGFALTTKYNLACRLC